MIHDEATRFDLLGVTLERSENEDSTTTRHEGGRLMRIVWRLRHAMPADLFQEAKG